MKNLFLYLAILFHVSAELLGWRYDLYTPKIYNLYSIGIALSILCWCIAFKYKTETKSSQFISGIWMIFLVTSVAQEISFATGYLQGFFGAPTVMHPSMIIWFGLTFIYVIYKLKKKIQ